MQETCDVAKKGNGEYGHVMKFYNSRRSLKNVIVVLLMQVFGNREKYA